MTASKYEQALGLNGADVRRRTGVDPETFAELEAVLHNREASKRKSGRPPALPVGAQLLLTLEFWREYRTFVHLGQAHSVQFPYIRDNTGYTSVSRNTSLFLLPFLA
jgi:hypothetical protein